MPLSEKDLPLTLPEVKSYLPTGTGESPLAEITDWVNTTCPKCGGPAKREINTMPQWAGSCWYYLRFIDPHNTEKFIDPEKEKYWMPVDLYVGGAEHAVLHLLYARFWHKVLYDFGLVSTKEPFHRLVNQGMILSYAYQRKNKALVAIDQVEEKDGKFFSTQDGEELERVVAKMSKSLCNVINPDEVVKELGADSIRLYEMFMGPLSVSKTWSTTGISGVYRFLDRIWRIADEKKFSDAPLAPELNKLLHKTIKKVSLDTKNIGDCVEVIATNYSKFDIQSVGVRSVFMKNGRAVAFDTVNIADAGTTFHGGSTNSQVIGARAGDYDDVIITYTTVSNHSMAEDL